MERRLAVVGRHLGTATATTSPASEIAPGGAMPVESALRRLPGGDGPGDAGVPAAVDLAVGATVILLHPPLRALAGVSIAMERGCQ